MISRKERLTETGGRESVCTERVSTKLSVQVRWDKILVECVALREYTHVVPWVPEPVLSSHREASFYKMT